MGDKTGISWTDATWNPVRGCSRVSEGCRNCYAERVAARFSDEGQPYHGLADRSRKGSKWTGIARLIPEHLADPLRWKKPRRIFVNSMSDLFHESLANEQIAAVFGVMAAAPRHTFQVLTKRAKRMREWFEWAATTRTPLATIPYSPSLLCAVEAHKALDMHWTVSDPEAWPLPNVWLGVSVENQEAADERIADLTGTPAAVRFLSCEPLIGPVNIRFWTDVPHEGSHLDWVIAGCESGPGARPCSVEWLRSLRDQCAAAGVPYFLKQAVADFRCGCDGSWSEYKPEEHRTPTIAPGAGSKRKGGGVIELPYLDGEQHAAFPEVP